MSSGSFSINKDMQLDAKLAKDWEGNTIGVILYDLREGGLEKYGLVCKNPYAVRGSGKDKYLDAIDCKVASCTDCDKEGCNVRSCKIEKMNVKAFGLDSAVSVYASGLPDDDKNILKKLRGSL